MQDNGLPRRALMTGFWVASLFVVVLATKGYPKAATGLFIGSALSLFSLWSLAIGVPMMLKPGGAAAVKLSFALMMMVKLPLYAGVLWFAVGSPKVSVIALFCGAGLIPAILVLKVIGQQFAPRTASPVGDERCPSNSSLSN